MYESTADHAYRYNLCIPKLSGRSERLCSPSKKVSRRPFRCAQARASRSWCRRVDEMGRGRPETIGVSLEEAQQLSEIPGFHYHLADTVIMVKLDKI